MRNARVALIARQSLNSSTRAVWRRRGEIVREHQPPGPDPMMTGGRTLVAVRFADISFKPGGSDISSVLSHRYDVIATDGRKLCAVPGAGPA
jgi:hypothetical protein